MSELNVYATTGTLRARRWLVGKASDQPDDWVPDSDWISNHTGIDPDSVTTIQQVHLGGETCWLVFIKDEATARRKFRYMLRGRNG